MNTSAILTALQYLAQDRVIHQCTFIVNKNKSKDCALQFGNPFTTGQSSIHEIIYTTLPLHSFLPPVGLFGEKYSF